MKSAQPTNSQQLFRALKSMPREEQGRLLAKIARDRALRRDLFDMAIIAARSKEPSRPFRTYLHEKRRAG